jgi:N-acetylmuramoyl-L-alanine amidase-like
MPGQQSDRRILKKLIWFLHEGKPSPKFPGDLVLKIGEFFIGTPYLVGTLEAKGAENLVINLRKLDCVTFVENVVAITWFLRSRERSFESFQRLLQKIRYRRGRLQGYSSRLHYFSEWIHDNQKKGILEDVTRKIGGRPFRKTINFMTTHPDLYLSLREMVNLRRMKSVERTISTRPLFSIPKKALRCFEDRIRDGDLIAIMTNREGLDVQHVGLAATAENRIHLLHASSSEGKVVLSKNTLYRYLMQSRSRSGIMVARLV